MFGTIEPLSAEEASRPSGGGGSTIAAHVHHMVFVLEASSAWIRGDRTPRDWRESWLATTVIEDEWARLQEELRRGYDELARAIEAVDVADEQALGEAIGEAIGAVAHAAYLLGAIRQKAPPANTR